MESQLSFHISSPPSFLHSFLILLASSLTTLCLFLHSFISFPSVLPSLISSEILSFFTCKKSFFFHTFMYIALFDKSAEVDYGDGAWFHHLRAIQIFVPGIHEQARKKKTSEKKETKKE